MAIEINIKDINRTATNWGTESDSMNENFKNLKTASESIDTVVSNNSSDIEGLDNRVTLLENSGTGPGTGDSNPINSIKKSSPGSGNIFGNDYIPCNGEPILKSDYPLVNLSGNVKSLKNIYLGRSNTKVKPVNSIIFDGSKYMGGNSSNPVMSYDLVNWYDVSLNPITDEYWYNIQLANNMVFFIREGNIIYKATNGTYDITQVNAGIENLNGSSNKLLYNNGTYLTLSLPINGNPGNYGMSKCLSDDGVTWENFNVPLYFNQGIVINNQYHLSASGDGMYTFNINDNTYSKYSELTFSRFALHNGVAYGLSGYNLYTYNIESNDWSLAAENLDSTWGTIVEMLSYKGIFSLVITTSTNIMVKSTVDFAGWYDEALIDKPELNTQSSYIYRSSVVNDSGLHILYEVSNAGTHTNILSGIPSAIGPNHWLLPNEPNNYLRVNQTLQSDIVLSSNTLNFGDVVSGETKTMDLTLSAHGLDEMISFSGDITPFTGNKEHGFDDLMGGDYKLTIQSTEVGTTFNKVLTISSGEISKTVTLIASIIDAPSGANINVSRDDISFSRLNQPIDLGITSSNLTEDITYELRDANNIYENSFNIAEDNWTGRDGTLNITMINNEYFWDYYYDTSNTYTGGNINLVISSSGVTKTIPITGGGIPTRSSITGSTLSLKKAATNDYSLTYFGTIRSNWAEGPISLISDNPLMEIIKPEGVWDDWMGGRFVIKFSPNALETFTGNLTVKQKLYTDRVYTMTGLGSEPFLEAIPMETGFYSGFLPSPEWQGDLRLYIQINASGLLEDLKIEQIEPKYGEVNFSPTLEENGGPWDNERGGRQMFTIYYGPAYYRGAVNTIRVSAADKSIDLKLTNG